ncbi:acyl-CoA thioesterase domain-containing protein [Streptomyces sp. NPDC021622]|uniref:acyl-CoA thioesterase n=1 Tax=Streptomyces sp. NPDC021622 TaxID=3155013 RepID=UPI0033E5E0DA
MTTQAQCTLSDLLVLDKTAEDSYQAPVVVEESFPLYGGQIAAQALLAAGLTVSGRQLPRSLHAAYLLPGDTTAPVDFEVERDRDGLSFSARRVVARQHGRTVFTMSASFHEPSAGQDTQLGEHPAPTPPEESEPFEMGRFPLLEWRLPAQTQPWGRGRPTRLWARTKDTLPQNPLLDACALTYLSDVSTGISGVSGGGKYAGITLDHTVWFHRQVSFDSWILLDMIPKTVAQGRGWYTGGMYTTEGTLAASLAQETLFPPAGPQR